MGLHIREARPDEHRVLASVLARAMADDAWVGHVVGVDPAARCRYFGKLLALPGAVVRCDDDRRGVALWFAPGVAPSPWAWLSFAPLVGLRRAPELAAVLARVAGLRPPVPHHHLTELGVDPEVHGAGLGTALLEELLAEADRGRRPVALETASPRAARWYERHDFELVRTIEVPDGPVLSVLWRPVPRPRRLLARRPMLHAGAAEVDLSPPAGLPLAGHGPGGPVAKGSAAPLKARVVALDGPDGPAAVVVADLLSGTAALVRAVEERTGLGGRVVLAGTHTHHGPGGLFGNALYDTFASSRPGADPALVEHLADRIAAAIEAARGRLVPARVGLGTATVEGDLLHNASPEVFRRTPEGQEPGSRDVDPEVSAIGLVGPDGPIAVLALAAAHASALDPSWPFYSPDWPGVAVEVARRSIRCPVALASGAAADVNVLGGGEQGPRLARVVGTAFGHALARAAELALTSARGATFALRTTEVDPARDPALGDDWCFGIAALGGAPDGRTSLYPLVSGRPAPSGDRKRTALGPVQRALRPLLPGPALWPLHVLDLGPARIVTVPGEVTRALGLRLRRALGDPATTHVLGYTGEYAGYFTTGEEYDAQRYEGASTLWGRASEEVLAQALRGLVSLSARRERA